VVVLSHSTLALKDLDEHTWLIVGVGGEDLRLLGRNSGVSGNENSHDTTGSLNTEGKRGNVEKEEILDIGVALTSENGSLDSGTIGDGLIGVDGSVEGLAVEEVRKHLLNLGNSGGSTDEHDFVDLALGETRVLEHILNGGHALSEKVHAKLLELGSGDLGVEVLTIRESFTLNGGLMGSREDSLGFLALSSESSESSHVVGDINAGLLLELSDAIVDESVVEVLTTKMSVAIGGLDLKDTFLNSEERDVEGATAEIEDEHVLLLG